MELGGMYGVRAYPEGEAYGDEGYVLNLEARYLLPKFSATLPGQMHLIGFVDTGHIKTYKDPWAAGDNTRTLSAAGVGIHWTDANNFLARAYYAVKLGNEDAISAPDKSGRFWFQLVKYF
jgi:hemolysin activation/secretion protein